MKTQALFIVGLQRSGTTITARLLCQSKDVGPGELGYCPYDRWDVAFIGEVGGHAAVQPVRADLDHAVNHATSPRYQLVKLALPTSLESLNWRELPDKYYSDARYIVVRRNDLDRQASLRQMPYLKPTRDLWDNPPIEVSFLNCFRNAWDKSVKSHAYDDRFYFFDYDPAVLAPVDSYGRLFDWLGIDRLPDTAFNVIRTPKNWSGYHQPNA